MSIFNDLKFFTQKPSKYDNLGHYLQNFMVPLSMLNGEKLMEDKELLYKMFSNYIQKIANDNINKFNNENNLSSHRELIDKMDFLIYIFLTIIQNIELDYNSKTYNTLIDMTNSLFYVLINIEINEILCNKL